LKGVKVNVLAGWGNIAITSFPMFTLVHLTGPFLLELQYEPTMKLGKITEVVNLWNLQADEQGCA